MKNLFDAKYVISRGSHIYGTAHEGSDYDVIAIVDDAEDLSDYGEIGEDGFAHIEITTDIEIDAQVMREEDFIRELDKQNIAFLELLWQPKMDIDKNYEEFQQKFKALYHQDDWKLRQWVSRQCNNSWAKCHKKLTVEKDYDPYIGRKSLWHVFRLYMYALQILNFKKILNYCPDLLEQYYEDIVNSDKSWEELKEKYQHIKNEFASSIRALVEKEK